MGKTVWTNPQPQGHGRAESLKAVMMAMREGKQFTPEETEAMREMYKQVMAGEKKLMDFGYLADRVAPPKTKESATVAENGNLDLRIVVI